MKPASIRAVRRGERRKNILDKVITAAVNLGEAIALQKHNQERRQQLSYLSWHLRQESNRQIPVDAKRLTRGHLKTVLRDLQYLDRDRRLLAGKATRFRDMIKEASVRLLKDL